MLAANKRPSRTLQLDTWDCGLACVCSAAANLGLESVTPAALAKKFRASGAAASVWSVDLVELLLELGAQPQYFSTFIGVRDAYGDMPYYSSTFASDSARVRALIAQPRIVAVACESHLDKSAIAALVRGGAHLAIALVDKRLLACTVAPPARNSHWSRVHSYVGHYVLLYDFVDDHFHYLDPDPAVRCESCVMSAATFDAARLADGTDEDLIVCSALKI